MAMPLLQLNISSLVLSGQSFEKTKIELNYCNKTRLANCPQQQNFQNKQKWAGRIMSGN